jgi:hypothetical protein
MTEQQQAAARRGVPVKMVGVTVPVHDRLGELRRQVALAEHRDLSLSDAVEWMLDRLDAADLP